MTSPGAESAESTGPDEAKEAAEAEDQTSARRAAAEQRHLAQEKSNERMVWWYLAYFLFGIHIVAFVMIYAFTHGK